MSAIVWNILVALLLSGVVMFAFVVPFIVFLKVFVRTGKGKWGYECQFPDNEEQVRLYIDAEAWAERYKDCRKAVDIENCKYHLHGEYYDFGCRRAAVIIAGRTEACRYSCYFAEPYRRAGYNVLTIDNRAHGFSDGRINTLGIREHKDILRWVQMLHDELQNDLVFLHGICIGSATALYAMVDENCPDYVCGMTADGMFENFGESFKNHLIEQRRPIFPCQQVCMFLVGVFAGRNPGRFGPGNVIHTMRKPLLFLHGRQDIYSVPDKAQRLYESCSGPKRLVWFDEGEHSFLRYHAPEKYDRTIMDFLDDVIHSEPGQTRS